MAELELFWVKECEICGQEHRQSDRICIASIAEMERETGSFHDRCERWYCRHVETMQAQHRGRLGRTMARA